LRCLVATELLQRLSSNTTSWPARLRALPRAEAKDLLYFAYREWISGDLSRALAPSYPHLSARELEREIGRALHTLPEEYFDREEIPIESSAMPDDTALARWCWASHWILFSDDEDIMFSMQHLPVMLEEAHHGCTKKEYVLAIVEHMLRDHAHASLWQTKPGFLKRLMSGVGLGTENVTASGFLKFLGSIQEIKNAARQHSAATITEYLERLFKYRGEHEVSEEEAKQRTLDLRRCNPSPNLKPELQSRAGYWVIRFKKANIIAGVLLINQKNGAMWAEETNLFFKKK
jgi:hypothetical protein